jgi:hypothetical protein
MLDRCFFKGKLSNKLVYFLKQHDIIGRYTECNEFFKAMQLAVDFTRPEATFTMNSFKVSNEEDGY